MKKVSLGSRTFLFALLSLTLTSLFVVSTAPAEADWTCHEVNQGSSGAPEWVRICAISNNPASFGGTFNGGTINWYYNGDTAGAQSGIFNGTLKDTPGDGKCVSLYMYHQPSATASWDYRFDVTPQVCGGNSKQVSCSFNLSGGCTPVLNATTGQITIRICTGSTGDISKICEVIWKQDMAVKHS